MTIDGAFAKEAYKNFFSREEGASLFVVEVDGLNELDPLLMLDVVGEATLTRRAELTATLIKGKKVEIFTKEGEKVHSFVFNGGTLSMLFTEKPYLLQTLIDYCFATVLKKLTPPSQSSEATMAE